MSYTDPTDFVGGTNGVHSDTNVSIANLQHVIVTDDAGNKYDYLIAEGSYQSNEVELWLMDPDTGAITLQQTVAKGGFEQQQMDDFKVIHDSDSNATYLFDTDVSSSASTGFNGGSNVMSWDPATASWSVDSQERSEFYANGNLKMDVFQADDGTIYGYAGTTGTSGTDQIDQYIFNETTKEFELDQNYTPSGTLGKDFNSSWEEGFETGEMEVLLTNDGPKLLQWNAGGVDRVEGFTLYDIDPATGDLVNGSASSYNFATQGAVDAFGTDPEILVTDGNLDEVLAKQQTSEISVDQNGNIVITNGTWGTTEGYSTGMIVIDPSLSVPDSADATQDGDGDVDNSASVLAVHYEIGSTSTNNGTVPATAWGQNAQITYSPDGAYMYVTSENITGSLDNVNTHTIVVDTSDYSIVDWGTDTTAGYYSTDSTNNDATTYEKGAYDATIVTTSTGEQFYIGQNNDAANAETGWLSVAAVTADLAKPVCFVAGTLIETAIGLVAIEDLSAGDMIETKDHGVQPIRWIGSTKRKAKGDLAPILIRKGALGNDRDLRVSPQHRMLVSGWQAELLFGQPEVLVAAKHLVNDHSIFRVEGGEVEYFHILFDDHEIIFAEGSPSESFHPGAEGQKSLSSKQAAEVFALFPELENNFENYGESAYTSLKSYEAKVLVENSVFSNN